ncbi:MAG: YceI family protein [Flavobacteriaceae bacterium]|nr:YceI family protein [Flavobacteriaceae bacterium]
MKKLPLLFIVLFLSTILVSCKKEAKKEPAKFAVVAETITVNWTGYKTTAKIPVKGQFKTVEIKNTREAPTALEALNGAEFSLPVSSLFSGDDDRDGKLKQLFFGVMDATVALTGTLNLTKDGKGTVNLKMNNVSKEIPVTYILSGQLVELTGTLDIVNDFQAQKALESISKACFELHKGPDLVSKTWSEVGIDAAIYLKKE